MMTTELERRSELRAHLRQEVELLVYSGPLSLAAAADLRTRVAAAAALAVRAGVDEIDWMLAAREAERKLGQMLLAGREAGEVAAHGWRSDVDRTDITSLADLGLTRDLGAEAVLLGRVPDDVWTSLVAEVEGDQSSATKKAFMRSARAYFRTKENYMVPVPAPVSDDAPAPPAPILSGDRSRAGQKRRWETVDDMAGRGFTSREIALAVGITLEGLRDGARRRGIVFPSDQAIRSRRRINSKDLLEHIVLDFEVTLSSLDLLEIGDISPEQARDSLARLVEPLKGIRQLQRHLKEVSS